MDYALKTMGKGLRKMKKVVLVIFVVIFGSFGVDHHLHHSNHHSNCVRMTSLYSYNPSARLLAPSCFIFFYPLRTYTHYGS